MTARDTLNSSCHREGWAAMRRFGAAVGLSIVGNLWVMMATSTAEPFVPAGSDLHGLAAAARGCRGCELFEKATQTVFGAGSAGAR